MVETPAAALISDLLADEIGVCGESAADIRLLPFYLSIGIDELSVVPNAILKLRSAMKDLDMKSLRYGLVSISLS